MSDNETAEERGRKARNDAPGRAPTQRKLRPGWRQASKRLRDAGEGGPVWPEFGNDGDKDSK